MFDLGFPSISIPPSMRNTGAFWIRSSAGVRWRHWTASGRALAGHLLDGFAGTGHCDFASDFAVPWPCLMFLNLLGLPTQDLPELLRMKDVAMRPALTPDDEKDKRQVGSEIYGYFDAFLADRSEHPQDDVIGRIITSEVGGSRLSRDELVDILYLFVLAGLDTVTASLECFFVYLAQHPEQRRRIVEEPQIIPAAIEELLRFETPVEAVPRVVNVATDVHGQSMQVESMVYAHLGAANNDEDAFDRPDEVDFDRQSNRHFSFGKGIHRCLGSHLARLELRIAIEEFHRRIPDYRIVEGTAFDWKPGIRSLPTLPLEFRVYPSS